MLKYKQLADKVAQDIQAQRLKDGDRMLSLRQFAQQHSISVSTAVSCYEELEKQGWISARPQAGFFINAHTLSLPSPTWPRFDTERTTPIRALEPKVIAQGPLGMACLDLDVQTQKGIEKSLRKAISSSQRQFSRYPDKQGEPLLRQALADHFGDQGFALNSQELVITHGCMDSVKTALTVCTHKGDTVAVSSPCFNGLLDLLSQLELNVIEIPSREDGIDLETLEALLQQKQIQAGLFCTTHMNPQGITLSPAQKQRLANLAGEYQVPIIEDDVYFELNHSDTLHLPTAYYDVSGYVIWCSSISKTLSPSYRLGWCRPGRYLADFQRHYQGVPVLIQTAIADFIRSGGYAKHLKRAQYQLANHRRDYTHYLAQRLPQGSRITQPDGGLVLWIQVPYLQATLLKKAAADANLDIRTGDIFTESERYHDCLRINMGYALNHQTTQLLEQLLTLIDQCRTKVSHQAESNI